MFVFGLPNLCFLSPLSLIYDYRGTNIDDIGWLSNFLWGSLLISLVFYGDSVDELVIFESPLVLLFSLVFISDYTTFDYTEYSD
jgi:hypothetical protein